MSVGDPCPTCRGGGGWTHVYGLRWHGAPRWARVTLFWIADHLPYPFNDVWWQSCSDCLGCGRIFEVHEEDNLW